MFVLSDHYSKGRWLPQSQYTIHLDTNITAQMRDSLLWGGDKKTCGDTYAKSKHQASDIYLFIIFIFSGVSFKQKNGRLCAGVR